MIPFPSGRSATAVAAFVAAVLAVGCAVRPPLVPSSEPGKPTVADARTRSEVLRSIGVFESANGGSATPVLMAVESLGHTGETWIERWTVSSNGHHVPYSVKLRAGTGERIDYTVERLATAGNR
jgi:anti-sigma-K factor RskA